VDARRRLTGFRGRRRREPARPVRLGDEDRATVDEALAIAGDAGVFYVWEVRHGRAFEVVGSAPPGSP
jgi:hypothetical protein